MEKENLEKLFEKLQGSFDIKEPKEAHRQRFLMKLEESKTVVTLQKPRSSWWKPLAIAASIAVLFTIGTGLYNSETTIDEQVAKISPEASNSHFYFANLIEEQVKQLENKNIPETKKMVDDTMLQLKKMESDYNTLEKDLLNGGNSKIILGAMITNFQTRIDLLQNVLNQIETVKNLKKYTNENFTL
ncbi:MAG: hypothetical protein QM485_09850 [Flavobacteriaceae bacterium]